MKLKFRSKRKEKEFLGHIGSLFEDLGSIVPDCLDKGFLCPFESYRKKLGSISGTDRIEKYLRSSDQFLSAISETHKISDSDSAPVVGFITTPYGNVEYAKRGNADETVLAGVQHFDDEIWRMLAFSSLSKTKGARVYSSKNFYLGSCKGHGPGIEFFKDVLTEHNIKFREDGDKLLIGNIGKTMVISHFSGIYIEIFEDSEYSTAFAILRHFLTKDISRDFSISCSFIEDRVNLIPQEEIARYFSGQIDDKTAIRSIVDARIRQAVSKSLYIIADRCYSDPDEFLGEFPNDIVNTSILAPFLESLGHGIYMDNPSLRKLLEVLWPQHGNEILRQIFPDLDENKLKSLKGNPLDQIERARKIYKIEDIESAFTINAWSKSSEFLISLVKDFFKSGKFVAIRNGEKNIQSDHVNKAIFFAFLVSQGELSNREWLFNDQDRELGNKMLEPMRKILGNDYSSISANIAAIRPFVP
ncbi:MAG: hypothetical protein QW597_01775 [Thermoplasmataceae archaeon]